MDGALFGRRPGAGIVLRPAAAWARAHRPTFATIPPAFFFVLALYLQQARGYGPLFSGVVFVAVGVGYFAAMIVANRLVARLGHHVLSLGSVCVSAGCVLLADEARAPSALALLAGLALAGFGIGAVLVPISATVLAGVDPAHAGAASGVLATAQQVGGAVGVALIGVLFFGGTDVAGSFALCARVLAVVGVLVAALAQLRHA